MISFIKPILTIHYCLRVFSTSSQGCVTVCCFVCLTDTGESRARWDFPTRKLLRWHALTNENCQLINSPSPPTESLGWTNPRLSSCHGGLNFLSELSSTVTSRVTAAWRHRMDSICFQENLFYVAGTRVWVLEMRQNNIWSSGLRAEAGCTSCWNNFWKKFRVVITSFPAKK